MLSASASTSTLCNMFRAIGEYAATLLRYEDGFIDRTAYGQHVFLCVYPPLNIWTVLWVRNAVFDKTCRFCVKSRESPAVHRHHDGYFTKNLTVTIPAGNNIDVRRKFTSHHNIHSALCYTNVIWRNTTRASEHNWRCMWIWLLNVRALGFSTQDTLTKHKWPINLTHRVRSVLLVYSNNSNCDTDTGRKPDMDKSYHIYIYNILCSNIIKVLVVFCWETFLGKRYEAHNAHAHISNTQWNTRVSSYFSFTQTLLKCRPLHTTRDDDCTICVHAFASVSNVCQHLHLHTAHNSSAFSFNEEDVPRPRNSHAFRKPSAPSVGKFDIANANDGLDD